MSFSYLEDHVIFLSKTTTQYIVDNEWYVLAWLFYKHCYVFRYCDLELFQCARW